VMDDPGGTSSSTTRPPPTLPAFASAIILLFVCGRRGSGRRRGWRVRVLHSPVYGIRLLEVIVLKFFFFFLLNIP
jgi:hypothetical protein